MFGTSGDRQILFFAFIYYFLSLFQVVFLSLCMLQIAYGISSLQIDFKKLVEGPNI